MLFDPRWEKPQVAADPLSLDALIAWLEKQPQEKTYNAVSTKRCLLGQWFKSIDPLSEPDYGPGTDSYSYIIHGKSQRPPDGYVTIVHGSQTFGAALERAKALRDRHG